MRIQQFALSVLFLALPLSAAANDVLGVYVSGKAGVSMQRQTGKDFNVSGNVGASPISASIYDKPSTKSTFGGGVAVGYDFHPAFNAPFRAELEYSSRAGKDVNAIKNLTDLLNDLGFGSASGSLATKVSTQTVMANGYWDLRSEIEGLKPFFSVGLGTAFNKMNVSVKSSDGVGDFSKSESKNRFAWSVGAGVGYEFSPSWVVELGYRYLDAGKSTVIVNADDPKVKIDINNEYHDFTLGLRYTF